MLTVNNNKKLCHAKSMNSTRMNKKICHPELVCKTTNSARNNKQVCHPELVSGSMFVRSTPYKKAAMFGLDARIALAIFGALSVITGAAMYSAIKNARATALLNDLNEVGKAWEAYYLDTGQNLPQNNTTNNTALTFYRLKTKDLVENPGVRGWNGPYLKYQPNDYRLKYRDKTGPTEGNNYSNVYLVLANDNNYTTSTDIFCQSGDDCFINVMINGLDDEGVIYALDKKIDKGNGKQTGILRWKTVANEYANEVHYKYAPIKNPND